MAVGFDLYPDNREHAFYGGVSVLIVMILSLSSPAFGTKLLPLSWLPLVAVFLWPRRAEPLLSLSLIFLLGIFHDLFAGYGLGLSSGLYIFVYALSRSRFDFQVATFYAAWFKFIRLMCFVSVSVLVFIFVFQKRFPVTDIAFEMAGAVAFFPVFFVIRRAVRRLLIFAVDE